MQNTPAQEASTAQPQTYTDAPLSEISAAKPNQQAIDTTQNSDYDDKNTTGGITNGTGEETLPSHPGGIGETASGGGQAGQRAIGSRSGIQRGEEAAAQTAVWSSSMEGALTDTNAISKPLNSYPAEKQNTIRSYIRSVDERIKAFVQRVKSGDLSFKRQKIADVSARAVVDIGNLLGVDVSGYTHNINTNGVQHILNRHGENGSHDKTMSFEDDIARIGWVLENYDKVEILAKDGEQAYSSEFMDQQNHPAPQVRFVKKIDGSYYVVEAAFENNYKKLWVQSAYLTKKEDVTQAPAEGQPTNHGTDAQSALASPSSINSIPQSIENVNPAESVGAAPADFTGKSS